MKSTVSLSVCALAALVAAAAGTVACSSDNDPATPTTTTPDDGDDGTGGDDGGDSTATGGATTTGTGGSTPASTDATGGEPAAGGATGASGAGTTAAAGAATASTEYTPLEGADCVYPETEDVVAPPDDADGPCLAGESKNATCPAEREGITCYKNCGPRNSSGWKPLTCTAGVIIEDSTCRWTGIDYAVWRVPAALGEMDPACPAEGTPRATDPCDIPSCISCANRMTGGYEDSSGAAKAGWCTCVGEEGNRMWTCGTAGKSWPCPGNPGC